MKINKNKSGSYIYISGIEIIIQHKHTYIVYLILFLYFCVYDS